MKNLNQIIKKVLNEQYLITEDKEPRKQKSFKAVCNHNRTNNPDGWSCISNRLLGPEFFKRKIYYKNGQIDGNQKFQWYEFGWVTDMNLEGNKVVNMTASQETSPKIYTNQYNCTKGKMQYSEHDIIYNDDIDFGRTQQYDILLADRFCKKIKWKFRKPKKIKPTTSKSTGWKTKDKKYFTP